MMMWQTLNFVDLQKHKKSKYIDKETISHFHIHSLHITNYNMAKIVETKTWPVALWCSGYHYYTTLFNKAWTQVLHHFKSFLQRVIDL